MTAKAKTGAFARRERAAALSLERAADALAGFRRGEHVFCLTKGQFSMLDIGAHLLSVSGPADVGVWTWCIADYEIEALGAFIADGRIRDLRLLMDAGGIKTGIPVFRDIVARFGPEAVRLSRTHAKIITIGTEDGWRIVARGSMNLNLNTKFEQCDVSDDMGVYDVVTGVMDEIWSAAPAPDLGIVDETQARASYEAVGGMVPDWIGDTGGRWW